MEILCSYIFSGDSNLVEKAKKRLGELQEKVSAIGISSKSDVSISSVSVSAECETRCGNTSACVIKSMKESTTSTLLQSPEERDHLWVKIIGISLKINDRNTTEQGLEFTDLHINSAQLLIKIQFPKLNGLKLSLLQAIKLSQTITDALKMHMRNYVHACLFKKSISMHNLSRYS